MALLYAAMILFDVIRQECVKRGFVFRLNPRSAALVLDIVLS